MHPKRRLWLSGVVIVLSALYAVLVASDASLAQVVALGYIAVVLTIFLLVHGWSRT